MMHEDGLSQKEILNYFKDLNETEIALIERLLRSKEKKKC